MQKQTKRWTWQWFGTVTGVLLLISGCLGSLLLLYGGGTWRTAAQLEASSLAAIQISELVGTNDYERQQHPSNKSPLGTLVRTFHLPFNSPLAMVQDQLPAPNAARSLSAESQSSLFQSLSNWETSTNKISVGWLQYDTSARTIRKIAENAGITVVSPDWFTLTSKEGGLRSMVQPDVVNYAHQHHIAVWAMFTNQFQAPLTHDFLSSDSARSRLIKEMAQTVQRGHLDGINVDFENVRSTDEAVFDAFIHELHTALKPLNAKLSVDITPDIAFLQDKSAFFHAGLSAECDYVVVMAYDEHWAGDQTAGPVADVPWVTSAVDDLLDTGVSADKLILGIPFYARFWHMHTDGSVSSEAVASSQVDNILASHKTQGTWDDGLGVAYARYDKPDGYEQVWYETDKTLNRKLKLVNNLGLAGVAIWSLSLSDKQTWATFLSSLRQSLT